MKKKYDILCIGRSSIDLYSNEPGKPFTEISSFGAFVGGSPLNIATQAQRLGLNSNLLTAVGQDQVGRFILHFLNEEGISHEYVPTLPERRSSAVVLGIMPPDTFPLVYYRDNCADSHINIDHVLKIDFSEVAILQISGTAFNIEPSRSACMLAMEQAILHQIPIILDLDFRADQWHDPRAYGITLRSLLPKVSIAIGTEEEILATMLQDTSQLSIENQQISAPTIKGNLDNAIAGILANGLETLIVKRGAKGASYIQAHLEAVDVPGYPVDVLNVLGAGDAFAGGFIYGFRQGWDLYKSCRMGNACGAIVVTRHGCANFMPTYTEVMDFVEKRGGLS